ncbi:MAG: hypothetical protein CMG74_03900 [Candidatus Marinimicrobia bacterium]|nr:hypothetical protein [Candidatus Neomarinimicrobiota bacterium]|tara:strand:+ start:20233 stop:20760 length:528 start_codon:yes stop_codon:yes gene_type:complete
MAKYFSLFLFITFYPVHAQVIFSDTLGIGDNENSVESETFDFNLNNIPDLLIVKIGAASLNLHFHYEIYINEKPVNANIQIENLDSIGIHWYKSEAWMHLVANEGAHDAEGKFHSQGNLISYVPNSFLNKGKNKLRLSMMDPYARYIDDYFVNHIELISIRKKDNEKLWDFTKKE